MCELGGHVGSCKWFLSEVFPHYSVPGGPAQLCGAFVSFVEGGLTLNVIHVERHPASDVCVISTHRGLGRWILYVFCIRLLWGALELAGLPDVLGAAL